MNLGFFAWLIGTALLYIGGFILGTPVNNVGVLSGFQAGLVGVALAQAAYNIAFFVYFDDGDLGGSPPPEPVPEGR